MNSFAAPSTLAAARPARPTVRKSPTEPGSRTRIFGLAVIVLCSLALACATASECHSVFYPPSLLYGLVLWGWWGCIAGAIWTIGFRKPIILGFSPAAIIVQMVIGCFLGIVHLLLLGSLSFINAAHPTALAVWTSLLNINRFGIEILIYGFILGIIGITHIQMRAQRDAMKSLELQKQLSEAQLRALQMQLEPHFLFNTLNAITTLVELGRQREASEMLGHLNAILKSTLKRTTPEKVPLSQELEVVENYLAIEQVRFADRLRIEIKVEPAALDSLVPCFLLQPIVENAIRHGIAQCESEGLVEATARRDGDLLRLEVRDTGSGRNGPAKPGNGIGLKNTRDRLTHFYQDSYVMKAQSSGNGFEVAIAIPYERS
ncbi:MAG: sensor histidine kinase [Terracidiphilus sp.]